MKLLQRLAGRTGEVDVPLPWATKITTTAAGTATVTIPAGVFTAAPIVTLTPVATSTTQVTEAELTAEPVYNAGGTVTVSIKTWRTQPSALGSPPVLVTAATVHVTAIARSL